MTEEITPNQKPHGDMCPCPHHKVVPLAVLIIGIAYLLSSFGITTSMLTDIVIGIGLVAIGGTKLNENKCKCC